MNKPASPMQIIPFYQPFFNSIIAAWKAKDPKWIFSLTGTEKKKFQTLFFKHYPKLPEALRKPVSENKQITFSASFNNFGALEIVATEPLTNEKFEILHRFGNVFNTSYTRFNDLKKAEAQAREAQIQLALERVRARTMAMHQSNELTEVVKMLYQEFDKLKISNESTDIEIGLIDEETGIASIWAHFYLSDGSITTFNFPIDKFIGTVEEYKLWKATPVEKRNELFFTSDFSGKQWDKIITWVNKSPELKEIFQPLMDAKITRWVTHNAYFSHGFLTLQGTSPYSTETQEIQKRFTKVFEQTYTRFLDLKNAEAQAREAQIEAALEKVRAVALSLKKSDEMLDIAQVLYEQLIGLGFTNIRNAIIDIHNEADETFWDYDYSHDMGKTVTLMSYHDDPIIERQVQQIESGSDAFFELILEGRELQDLIDMRLRNGESEDPRLRQIEQLTYNLYSFGNGAIGISNFGLLSDDQKIVLKRFRNVFAFAYKRYNDLALAETQAREAQIEASLERVRSRTMAMHQSRELNETAELLYRELTKLGIEKLTCGFTLLEEKTATGTCYMANPEGSFTWEPFYLNHSGSPVFLKMFESWKKQEAYQLSELAGQVNIDHNKYLAENADNFPMTAEQLLAILPPVTFSNTFNFRYGYLLVVSLSPFGKEQCELISRFARVFEQTYTRFLDLQKAEAQAREAQIELGLERVRARAMAMQKSEELANAARLLYHEFGTLGINTFSCGYMFIDEAKQTQTAWVVLPDGSLLPNFIVFPLTGDHVLDSRYKDWKEKKPLHTYEIKGEVNKEHHRFLSNHVPQFVVENIFSRMPDRVVFHCANFSEGYLLILATELFSPEDQQTIIRFAKVFEMTYTRFLDLQKAEAQAREAQIEASLERVRAKAMAMHSSKDLSETLTVFYRELKSLSVVPRRCGIAIMNKAERLAEVITMNTTEQGDSIEVIGHIKMSGHKILDEVYENWLMQKEYHAVLKGNEIKQYYQVLKPQMDFPDYSYDIVQYGYYFMFKEGDVYAWTEKKLSEDELKIYRRFTTVISLTYKRYKDLQHAEAQTREAQIEAALERVRSRTLAMQKSDELAETAAVMFNQLIHLGIAPNRLYIGIINDESGDIEAWATDEDGSRVSKQFILNVKNPSVRKIYDGWRENKKTVLIDMQGKELEDYLHYLHDDLDVPFKQGLTQKRRVQNIAYFSKGFIGIASPEEQPEETAHLLERFAAVFNLTYTRFNDLKIAEAHAEQAEQDLIAIKEAKQKAEEALTELLATQKQLIQSEKMASLGELTAGIAHEIQNPLNFVNNFSEVSKELLDEMKEAMEKGDTEEAKEIMSNVIQNLEKITHHGKRADGIVKGMLQHSRSSSNQKEPTDINALAGEYLRLAYHGLRAKDKSFNATMKTDFDESIGNINIIPQDIGRVVLNLITNAFYVVNEKSKQNIAGYDPTVTVKTSKTPPPAGGGRGAEVLIAVKDNGNGIPQKILDKIFQPFFTTKPTGQGTGLGLSLSYDIVKAHGGALKVETKEGEGSEFIIQLPVV
jgi:signal transduction histidine kinase